MRRSGGRVFLAEAIARSKALRCGKDVFGPFKEEPESQSEPPDSAGSEGDLVGSRGAEARGTHLQPCCPFSRLLPQLGSPPLGDIDGRLSGGPPSPTPASRNTRTLAVGTGSVGPRFPAARVGRHQAGPACPRRDRGPIEPAFWTSRDNSHTEAEEHWPACLYRKSPGC